MGQESEDAALTRFSSQFTCTSEISSDRGRSVLSVMFATINKRIIKLLVKGNFTDLVHSTGDDMPVTCI